MTPAHAAIPESLVSPPKRASLRGLVSLCRRASLWALTVPGAFALWGCKDPYVSPYKAPATGYLVVEGYISGNSTSQFALSRSIPLPGDSALPTENGATVQIEGSDNSVYPLTGEGNGVYTTVDTLQLNTQLEYRLNIQIASGEKYQSDFVPYKPTPSIDSVNWVQNGDNSIQIYVNTHDPADNTHYYQWNFDQTYEYHSAEESDNYWDKDTMPPAIEPRAPQDQVFRCWQSGSSTNIIIDNTTKLSADLVYRQPVKYIPPDDVQSSVLYSILVRQYSLTADGYNFLSLMQQNTESLGSIFDAQPSQITGNIHSLTHPTEQVIGYVSAGTVQSQRIFIYRNQIKSMYSYSCPIADTLFTDSIQYVKNYGSGVLTPMYFGTLHKEQGWVSNYTFCLVCTTAGGTNHPPSYWPN
ncbi:MAG TPA: DUF4249 domain-containing protein [Puia sp.]|nr:DUF4249 domain-containing protein [Puia sp.]